MPQTDDWGGIAVGPATQKDDWGGIAVAQEKDDWGGIAVPAASATSVATPEQVQQFADAAQVLEQHTHGPGSLSFGNDLLAIPSPYDPLAPENQPQVTPGKPMGVEEKVRRFLSPLLGPTPSQQTEEAVDLGKKDEHGNPIYEYKPLAGRLEKEGLFSGYLGVKPMEAKAGDSAVKSVGKAIFNQAAALENSLLSPAGIATAGIGSEFQTGGRVLSGLFAADMALHVPGQLDQLAKGKTLQERIEGGLGAIVSLLTAGTAGTHALAGEHPSLQTVIDQTRKELDNVTPPSTPLTKESIYIPDQTLDGLNTTRAVVKEAIDSGKLDPKVGNKFIDHIDDTLLKADKDAVRASEARVAQQRAQTPPTEGEVPPVSAGGPPEKGGTSSLFKQAQAESGVTPEAVTPTEVAPEPVTDPALHDATSKAITRIRDEIAQQHGDAVADEARVAMENKADRAFKNGKIPSREFLKKEAIATVQRKLERGDVSLEAENAAGQTVGETQASEAPTPVQEAAKADMIDAVQKQVQELPENIQKTAKAFLEAAQNGESTSLRDLGEKLGVSQQTVANHLKQMRDHFTGLKEEGYSVGPGAASISENLNNTIDSTSLKRAVVDVQREVEGRDAIDVPNRPTSEKLVDEADERLSANPDAGKELVDKILENKVSDQQVSPTDAATMLVERARLRNARADAEAGIADIHASEEDRASAKDRLDSITGQIDRLDQASRIAGTAWSDFGRLYQQVIKDDYSLEALERKAIAAKGEPMTRQQFKDAFPEEHAKLVEQAKRISELEAADEANSAKVKEAERLQGVEDAFNKFKAEVEKTSGFSPRVIALAKSIVDRLDKSADAARARIRDRLKNASAGIDPTVVYDIGVIGASKLAHATIDFAKFSSEMISEFGDWVEPHLKDAWDHANKIWKDEEKKLGSSKPAVTKVRDKAADATTKQDRIVGSMKERINDGDKITDLGRFVQSLARELVAGGIRDREALVDAVHDKLKTVDPTITREMTQDAISGYGDFRELPKGDVDVALRDIKGQLQQVGKIRDLMNKKAPQKTGVERRVPSDEERRLQREVNDLKKKGDYEVTDPETQLKSSMDAIKTRLRNEIRDLDHAVATGERIKAKTGSPEYDAEAKALKTERDAKRELYDKTFPKEPLTTEQQLKRVGSALDRSIAGLEDDLKRGKLYDDPKAPRLTNPEIEAKRARLAALRDERDTLRQADTERVEQEKENALGKRIADTRNRILTGDTGAKTGTPTAATERVAKLQEELKGLQKQLQDARKGPARTPEEIALQAYKTRATNRIAELKERQAKGDFSSRPRTEVKLDAEGQKIKAQLAEEKLNFDRAREKDRLANRPGFEKVLDGINKWRRAFVLSGPRTLAKLTSAAGEILAIAPVEEAVGGAISGVERGIRNAIRATTGIDYKTIAEKAPRHGGFNPRAEVEAVKGTWRNLFKDAGQELKTGHTNLDLLYGKPDIVPRSFLDYIGQVHGALKTPAKRNEFIRSFQKRVDFADRHGVDVSDTMVQMRIGQEAYKDANRSIFREDNFVVTAYNNMLRGLTQKMKDTGRPSMLGKTAEAAIKYTLPVVRIPTNIVARTFEYSFGHGLAAARIARSVFQEGLNNLSPHDADVIMRNLKRGSLGAAVMALGYFNADKIGGYYQPGQKRDENDVKFGKVRVFGHDVPSYLIHNPLLEQLQIGATIRRVAESKLRKKDSEPQGAGSGAMAAALGVIQEAPFLSDAELAVKLKDPNTRPSAIGELAKGAVPVLLQNVAEAQDKDAQGETVKREPKSEKPGLPGLLETGVNAVKLGIPGLRKTVPPKETHRSKSTHKR